MADLHSVDVTYVPADCGSMLPGKSKAPKAFQDVEIAQQLREAGWKSVSEHHALETSAVYQIGTFTPGGVRNEELNISVCQQVQQTIARNLSSSAVPPFQLILGGECCMLPAILSAFWHYTESQPLPQRVGLVYIDADTDLASPSDPDCVGYFAGMNMTHLVRSPGALKSMNQFSRFSGGPVSDSSNTVLFGTNMAHPGNKNKHFAYLFDNGYKVISSASVAKEPEQRATEALKYLENKVDVIMVHLDVDAIDPQLFPLPNVPNFTGVGFEQMMSALGIFLGSDMVRGLTIAEVNPDHDPSLQLVNQLTREVVRILSRRSK